MSVYVASSYLDFNNIEEPIQTFYRNHDITLYYRQYYETRYNIKPNRYTLLDSIYEFASPKTGKFYTVERENSASTGIPGSLTLYQIKLSLSNEHDDYHRSVLTLVEAVGVVGGIYEIALMLLKFLLPIFTQRILEFYLVKRLSEGSLQKPMTKTDTKVHNYQVVNHDPNKKHDNMLRRSNFKMRSGLVPSIMTRNSIQKSEIYKPKPSDALNNVWCCKIFSQTCFRKCSKNKI